MVPFEAFVIGGIVYALGMIALERRFGHSYPGTLPQDDAGRMRDIVCLECASEETGHWKDHRLAEGIGGD